MGRQKDDKKKPEKVKSTKAVGKKSARRSVATTLNKRREASRRLDRLNKADIRRHHAISEVLDHGPKFRRARGKGRTAMIERSERCEAQIARIDRKRATRKRLAGMTPFEHIDARRKGERQFSKAT